MDPASDEYMRAVEDAIDVSVQSVEHAIILSIAEALRDAGGLSPSEAAARASSLARQAARTAERGAGDVAEAVDRVMAQMGEANAEWAAPYYEAAGATMGAAAAAAVEEGRRQAVARVGDLMRTSALEIVVKEAGRPPRSKPIAEAYRAIVRAASAEMASGATTGKKAVSRAVTEALGHMCEGGVRIRYESGRTRELYGAVRMNVMDAYRMSMQAGREAMGREFGADGVEVSAHGTCAPDHLPHQGRTYPNGAFAEVQASLERPIAQGYNCRHVVYPVILGALPPANSEEDLRRMAEFSTEEVSFTGAGGDVLTMTRYEATQYQRRMEQAIRRANLEAECAEKAGTDPAPHKARAKDLRAVYRSMSAECGLATDLTRTRVHIPR